MELCWPSRRRRRLLCPGINANGHTGANQRRQNEIAHTFPLDGAWPKFSDRSYTLAMNAATWNGLPRGDPGIRDLASLSKTLARNRKSCTGVAATKGQSPWLRARAVRQGGMLWRDLRAAIKTEMEAPRQVMKQSDRAKRSELAVALMVERIKSTTSYAQMGARAGITAERARARGSRCSQGRLRQR
jgi:hypothetical protein